MSNFENQVQKDHLTESILCESAEEFILPDYMPEIERVLHVGATLLPDAPYLSAENAAFSGRIAYRLLYSDSDGKITEAPLEARYGYSVATPLGSENAYAEEKIENVALRPLAPRKVSVRTRILSRTHALKEETVGESLSSLLGEEGYEVLPKEQKILSQYPCTSGVRQASTYILLEGVSPASLKLLSANASVLCEAAEASDGYLSVRGKVIATLLLSEEEGAPFLKSCEIPFEEIITESNARENDAVTLRAFCPTPSVTLSEEGEGCQIAVEAEYEIAATLYRNQAYTFLSDFYLHGKSHTVTRKPFSCHAFVGSYLGNITFSAEAPLPEGLALQDKVLLPALTVKETEASLLPDRAFVEGSLSASLLALGENGGERTELSLPFRIEFSPSKQAQPTDTLHFYIVPVGETAVPTANGVRISCELSVCAYLLRSHTLSLPVGAEEKPSLTEKDEGIRIYYPTGDDTLWSVGKKYACPLSVLKKQNGIPENEDTEADSLQSLDGYAYLFVGSL